MGCYINPPTQTKEQFLQEFGLPTKEPMPVTGELLPVCLVNNGAFNAAAVCFNERELEAFNQPHDNRLKQWYVVNKKFLYPVCDLHRYEK